MPPEPVTFKIPGLRWWIAVALFAAAILNYIDRNVLGLLAKTIQQDLQVTDQQYATVVNWFLVAYTVAYLVSGRVVDKLGVRLSMVLFVGWWSVSNALTGLAQSVRSLALFRGMLGLGEAGCFTAAPKAISEWFPPSERGLAIGLYSIGGAVGATIAPVLVALIAARYGWRWVFAVSPVLGGLWILIWLRLYRPPAEHPRLTEKERLLLAPDAGAKQAEPVGQPVSGWASWKEVLREPAVWRLMLARLLTDPVWYFYQFWMPKYLQDARGLDQKGVAIMWLIFLAADIGFLMGGFLSGGLVKRGVGAPAARLWVMGVSAGLVPLSLLVPGLATVGMVIAVGMAVTYAHTAWLGNLTALVVDITPGRIVGTAFGVIACGSALGGIFMNQIVAAMIGQGSYDRCFYIMACVHPLAILLVWGLRRRAVAATVR